MCFFGAGACRFSPPRRCSPRAPAFLAISPVALVQADSVRLLLLGGACSRCVGLLASSALAGAAVADARCLVSRGLLALGTLDPASSASPFLASERSRRPPPASSPRVSSPFSPCCPRLLPPRRPPRHGHPPGPPIKKPQPLAPDTLVLADARPPALPALAPDALVLADARPLALLALAPLALVRADARAPTHQEPMQGVRGLADARAPALLASAPLALVLWQMLAPPRTPCIYSFGTGAGRFSRPRTPCIGSFGAGAGSRSRPRTPCICSFGASAGRCPPPRTPCMCS